ncbi:17837_t:CDS:2 [Funneliformis geosporum]|uniref:16138_t:CDS:1 n=1 Tax=Funneliformis geosporum TaxID=1117311 RepID=A0A9W4SHS3_9GLOM|nr:17837_t:CDS:2 [Funneliformis geosporum]CAI2169456.1 16138_t:CDS:2 [Funneliformis geosporum]
MADPTTPPPTVEDLAKKIEDIEHQGDVAWVLMSTALVFLMIPGVGYFYSGMARSKNALSLIMLSCLSVAVVMVQWWAIGFSLAFGESKSHFIGNLQHAFFMGVGKEPLNGVVNLPGIVFALYQGMFAGITPALAIGSAAERGRIVPAILFIFIWSTLVYDPIACWTWNVEGWSAKMGGLDFAGGTPVHIASGAAALAYCIILGKRHAYGANARAGMAATVTSLSAAVGGLTWVLMDYRLERKLSALGFCSGAVAGLVSITPGSGFVGPAPAVAFGFLGGFCCNFAVKIKHIFDFDDALDVFAVHGVGGIVGNLLTGIFAQQSVIILDGQELPGGWLNGNWVQLGYQAADSLAGLLYSFVVTFIILFLMDKVPGLSLRADPESEARGLDETELGELAYYHVDRLISVNTRTGETKTVKEETIHQQNDTNATIV